MSGGFKYDGGKPRMDLIPPKPLLVLGQVYAMGAKKYADRQWEQGMDWGRVYAALQRHLQYFWGGEDIDPESGLPHLAHAAWNVITLLEYMETCPELDSRATARNDVPKRGGEVPAPNPASREDVEPVPQGNGGLLVLREVPRPVDRVQISPTAEATFHSGETFTLSPAGGVAGQEAGGGAERIRDSWL